MTGVVVPSFELFMPGKPLTRQEPLWGRRGPYPNPATTAGMRSWRSLWMAAGSPLVEEPICLEVYVRVARPATHILASGKLSSRGAGHRYPGGFDCSNVVKLVEDALKTTATFKGAFGDDSEIVALHATKRWLRGEGQAGTRVTFTSVGAAYE